MSVRFPIFAITHIHTDASNGQASEMDAMISGALKAILGEDTRASWSECFTKVDRLVDLIQNRRHRPAIGIITVTDHMNVRSHQIPDALLRAAAQEPRLAASAEINTVEKDIDGVYRRAPEVLVYGGSDPVEGPYGPHYGLSQQIIDDIFANCRAPGLKQVRTSLVLGHCAALGLACALAHPFDGHFLSLEATLDLISQARYIETVNGGFPAVSTRILEDLISFQNRVVSGWRMSAQTVARYPLAKVLEERIVAQGRSMLHPWGGSDAHSHNFSRVVNRFLAFAPSPTAGDLFEAMLKKEVIDHLIDGTFSVQGRPGTSLSVVDDVVRIVLRNIWANRPHILDSPGHAWSIVTRAHKVVRGELGRRATRQDGLVQEAAVKIDFNQVLSSMRPPHRLDIHQARQLDQTDLPSPLVLPSYLLDAHHEAKHRSYEIN